MCAPCACTIYCSAAAAHHAVRPLQDATTSAPPCARLQAGNVACVSWLLERRVGAQALVDLDQALPPSALRTSRVYGWAAAGVYEGLGSDWGSGLGDSSRLHPMFAAVRSGNEQVVDVLLRNGARIDVRDSRYMASGLGACRAACLGAQPAACLWPRVPPLQMTRVGAHLLQGPDPLGLGSLPRPGPHGAVPRGARRSAHGQ